MDWLVTVNLLPGTDPKADVNALWAGVLWCRQDTEANASRVVLDLVRLLPQTATPTVWTVTDVQPAANVIERTVP